MGDHAKTLREVRELERVIGNCLHGGPPASEVGTPWFLECIRLTHWNGNPAPTDPFLAPGSEHDDRAIRTALIETVRLVGDKQRGFPLALANPGSSRCFAAMAVDAWAEEDFRHVRMLLIKALVVYHLQKADTSAVLRGLRGPQTRHSLLERVKGVVQCHDWGLMGYLELMNAGACSCIGLARTLNDKREALLNPDADERAVAERRKRREAERLPPVLKPGAEYWGVKEEAASRLQRGELERSYRLYAKARGLLERQEDLEAPLHQLEWLKEVAKEKGKLASNLSMISLRRGLGREALEYAQEAVGSRPNWSKSHCRRAQALQSLGRLEDARLASKRQRSARVRYPGAKRARSNSRSIEGSRRASKPSWLHGPPRTSTGSGPSPWKIPCTSR